jgi:molybdate transport system substrate-binding protein
MSTLSLLSGGAAQGLVKALQERFTAATGATLQARFGAVGAMKEALLAGEPCDVMIVTGALVDSLVAEGRLRAEGRTDLGRVRTGIAVKTGTPHPDVSTAAALKAALLAADGVYFPDPVRATAGIHFADVLRRLGIHAQMAPRFRTYPAGAIAMRELAAAREGVLIGCTQVTEIKYTEGVDFVGLLPPEFELATVYTAAVAAGTGQTALAQAFIALMASADALPLRAAGGFE